MILKNGLIGGICLLVVACAAPDKEMAGAYPETTKTDHVDTYFDHEVADPYRWLEDDMSEETAQWVAEENKVTFDYDAEGRLSVIHTTLKTGENGRFVTVNWGADGYIDSIIEKISASQEDDG